MSDLTDRIRAEHRLDTVQGCICGAKHTGGKGWWSKHIAEVTEAAVRAQIAADIEAHCDQIAHRPYTLKVTPFMDGLTKASQIAKGGAS